MSMRRLILAIATFAATAFIAGGLYLLYVANAPQQISELSSPGTPVTATPSDKESSFSVLDAPRPLPDLTFVDGDGEEMTLKAFEGQFVLLNIWATWCVPCREEMPSLDRLQARLGGPDFKVVPLSIDREGLPAVKAFYEELGLKALGVYVDQSGKASGKLGAVGIPTTLLVDREGREIGRTVGPVEWDSDDVVKVLQLYVKPGASAPQAAPKGAE
jgi:thiol-disulfide isomerase/thioredoxin